MLTCFPVCSIRILALLLLLTTLMGGCARLPETTRVIQEDDRVVVRMETDPDAEDAGVRSTATDIPLDQLNRLLRGFSVRQVSGVPIRFLNDDQPPKKFLRERELEALVPVLQKALQKVGSQERVRFQVLSPGRNPRYWRDVTGGWIKVRDRYFHLKVDYYHVEQPVRRIDAYDPNYPSPWTPEQAYAVYFEPHAQYVMDPMLNSSAVDLNKFLVSASP